MDHDTHVKVKDGFSVVGRRATRKLCPGTNFQRRGPEVGFEEIIPLNLVISPKPVSGQSGKQSSFAGHKRVYEDLNASEDLTHAAIRSDSRRQARLGSMMFSANASAGLTVGPGSAHPNGTIPWQFEMAHHLGLPRRCSYCLQSTGSTEYTSERQTIAATCYPCNPRGVR
jgi:hypothetical protein